MTRTDRIMDFRVASWLRHKSDCEDDYSDQLRRAWDDRMERFLEERERAA